MCGSYAGLTDDSGERTARVEESTSILEVNDDSAVTAEEYDNDADDSTFYHVDECPKQK